MQVGFATMDYAMHSELHGNKGVRYVNKTRLLRTTSITIVFIRGPAAAVSIDRK